MTIRLNKVTRDLNVGITTAVEFLQKKGFTVEANPNTKITDEQFELLKKEFSTDKDLKIKSERFSQERQSKDRNKASVSIDGYRETQEKAKPEEIKTVVPEDARPKFKPVGKIDLDKLNRRPAPAQEKEKEAEKSGRGEEGGGTGSCRNAETGTCSCSPNRNHSRNRRYSRHLSPSRSPFRNRSHNPLSRKSLLRL